MTFLAGLGRLTRSSIESDTVPLTSANLAAWLTGHQADAGVDVSEKRVLGLPAYFRAVAVTAGTIASLPIKVMRAGTREPFKQRTVFDRPNPRQTAVEWKLTSATNALSWGAAFDRKLRDGSGTVREVWPIHPSRVRVEEDDPSEANRSGKVFLIRDRSGVEHRYTDVDIMHRPYISTDGVCGVRPLELFRQSLGIAIAGDTASAKLFKNGSMMPGIITTDKDLTGQKEVVDRLRARWKEMTAGVGNAGEVGILDNGAKYQPIALPPGDVQLLESRKWAVTEIVRMIGTPPHLAGDVERSTSWGTGIEEQVLNWVKFTLNLWIISHEERYNAELLPNIAYCKHSLEGLLRGDSKARAAFYHAGITDGWLNRNEVRELEDREPVDGLDEFIVPSNMTLIYADGSLVPASSSGVSDPGAAG